jgi:pantoate--beta-alanine ligase
LEIFTTKSALSKFLSNFKKENKITGFVPTMGALHLGHLSLISRALEVCDVVICSIFVNPTQFNNPADLERYPRPVERDIKLLTDAKCDVLFMPDVEEMYAQNEDWNYNLGYLEEILEGEFRTGHYQGVTQIVKKLLDAVNPDKLFLGQKDFQQVRVIDHMIKSLRIPVKTEMCPIVREKDGLAFSSRNVHLSAVERKQATVLSKVLFDTKEEFNSLTIDGLKSKGWQVLNAAPGICPEYFEICDAETLLPVSSKEPKSIVALLAAKVGSTRLIDNIILK